MNREEFLKEFSFVSYITMNPDKNYDMKGAVLLVDSKGILLVFKHLKNKKTGGYYFAAPSFSYKQDDDTNKFTDLIDSTSQRMWLLDFVKEQVQKIEGNLSASPVIQGGVDDSQCPF